jgi:hypothetical protein
MFYIPRMICFAGDNLVGRSHAWSCFYCTCLQSGEINTFSTASETLLLLNVKMVFLLILEFYN